LSEELLAHVHGRCLSKPNSGEEGGSGRCSPDKELLRCLSKFQLGDVKYGAVRGCPVSIHVFLCDLVAHTKREDVYIQVVCFPYAGPYPSAAEKPRTPHRRQWRRRPPSPSEKYNHAAHRYDKVIGSMVPGIAARVISMCYQHRHITAVGRQERKP
jgi:hypothetical protein